MRQRGEALAGLAQSLVAALGPLAEGIQRGPMARKPSLLALAFDVALGIHAGEGRGGAIGRAGSQQAIQIQRPAGLGSGAGQAFATERLHPDHGADDVAVDVEVADVGLAGHLGDGFVDAGVHAEGQAVAAGVDLVEQLVELFAWVAQHVQDRAEDFPLQLVEAFQLDQSRHHEGAASQLIRRMASLLHHAAAFAAHGRDVLVDVVLGLAVDHRADVGGQVVRVADAVFGHGAFEHGQHALGHVLLHAQHAQRRAALAGAVEGRGNDIQHHLFGQCRGVDDHRVLAAGFGDQRQRSTLGIQASGEVARDDRGNLGGAGEHHAADALVAYQRIADHAAIAGQQLQHAFRQAGLQQQVHGLAGDQRRLLGGLGQHGIARRQRGGHLAGEDRHGEVPRADADHRPQRAMAVVAEVLARLHGVEAQEVHRLAHLGDAVAEGLAGFAGEQAHQRLELRFHQVGGAFQHGGTLGRRGGLPDRCGGLGGVHCVADVLGAGLLYPADQVAQIGRVAHFGPVATALGTSQNRPRAPLVMAEQRAGQRGQAVLVGQIEAAGIGAHLAVQLDRQWDAWMR